jgi:ubiquinone/menaquinone biosynthesis C-methylase UbiE
MSVTEFICPICAGSAGDLVFVYNTPPKGEVNFDFSKGGVYYREVIQCKLCGHYVSRHEMDDASLYNGEYVNANYRDAEGILKAYEKINALDPSKSDNVGRVRRVNEIAESYFASNTDFKKTVLDVGSGLCVFLGRMKAASWNCTALDPDERAVNHAVKNVGVNGVCGDFMSASLPASYDLITFNKVLEHVPDPTSMLARAKTYLGQSGMVYVEVPDAECAQMDGPEREEFCIDHPHVFSFLSLAMMCKKAGFVPVLIERLREPSTKYTLRAFLRK